MFRAGCTTRSRLDGARNFVAFVLVAFFSAFSSLFHPRLSSLLHFSRHLSPSRFLFLTLVAHTAPPLPLSPFPLLFIDLPSPNMPPFPASATSDHINTSYHYSLPTSTPYRNPSLHHMPAHSSSSTFPPFSAAAAPSTPSTTPGAQHSVPDSAPGTTENPLIPKRRRRTTPAELAILETEFRVNPRPDPQERARIAGRLGMTIRAVQVWLQNRRYVALFSAFPRPTTTSRLATRGVFPA